MAAPAAGGTEQIAVLGIGALEQHGRHLPIGTDWLVARELSQRVAAELGAKLLPPIPFSLSECHGALPGTVWLKPATLAAVLRDLVLDLRRAGIRNLLVISGHGGNFILGPAIQSLLLEFPEMRIALPGEDWPNEEGGRPIFDLSAPDIHAGEIETSLVLALFPDLVGDERVDDVPDAGREFLDYVTLDRLSENGVWGRPSAGDAEKGRRALAVQTRRIVDFARRSFRGQP